MFSYFRRPENHARAFYHRTLAASLMLALASLTATASAVPIQIKKEPPERCHKIEPDLKGNLALRKLELQNHGYKDIVAVDPTTGKLFFNAALHSDKDKDGYSDVDVAGWIDQSKFTRYLPRISSYLGAIATTWIGSSTSPFTVYGFSKPINTTESNTNNTFVFAYNASSPIITALPDQDFDNGSNAPVIRSSHNGEYIVLQYDGVNQGSSVIATVYKGSTKISDLKMDIASSKNLDGLSIGARIRGISDDGNIILVDISSLGQFGGSDVGIYIRTNSEYQQYITALAKQRPLTAQIHFDEQYHLYTLPTAGTPLGLSSDGKTLQFMARTLNIYNIDVESVLQGNYTGKLLARYDSTIPLYKCDFETDPDLLTGHSYCNEDYTDPNDPNNIPISPPSQVWGQIKALNASSIPFIDYMNIYFEDLMFRDVYRDGEVASLWRFEQNDVYGRVTIGTFLADYAGSDVIPHLFYCDLN